MKQINHFINGEFVLSADNKQFGKRSPVDHRIIAQISEAGKVDVDLAV